MGADVTANAVRLCSVEGCAQPHSAHGWCELHYKRWQRTGSIEGRQPKGTCEIPGCDTPHYARCLCALHYDRLRRNGDPMRAYRTTSPRRWGSPTGDRLGYMQAWRREKFYRLTPDAYDTLLASQGGGCAVCGDTDPVRGFQVNHDHACCDFNPTQQYRSTCGQCVRGILCARCNATGDRSTDPVLATAWRRFVDAYAGRCRSRSGEVVTSTLTNSALLSEQL